MKKVDFDGGAGSKDTSILRFPASASSQTCYRTWQGVSSYKLNSYILFITPELIGDMRGSRVFHPHWPRTRKDRKTFCYRCPIYCINGIENIDHTLKNETLFGNHYSFIYKLHY